MTKISLPYFIGNHVSFWAPRGPDKAERRGVVKSIEIKSYKNVYRIMIDGSTRHRLIDEDMIISLVPGARGGYSG